MVETRRSTAEAASKRSSPSPSSPRFDLWFNRYESSSGERAREERQFGRGHIGVQERSRRG